MLRITKPIAVMYIAVSDWNNGPVEDAPNNALRYDEAIVEFHRLLGNQPLVADEIREANSLQSGTPQLRSTWQEEAIQCSSPNIKNFATPSSK